MTDFLSKALQKIKSKVTMELIPTISQATTESVAMNDKTNPYLSTETPPSTTNTAAPTPAQKEVKQKIKIKDDILEGQYQKGDPWQHARSDHKQITSREAMLRKYKTYLKAELLCVQAGRGKVFVT